MSMRLGLILEVTWVLTSRGTIAGNQDPITQAKAMEAPTPAATRPMLASKRQRQPLTMAPALPMIGVISGAMSMAPMTTAVESWRMPKVAMATESSSMIHQAASFLAWEGGSK